MVSDIVVASILAATFGLGVVGIVWFIWRFRESLGKNIRARIDKSTARVQKTTTAIKLASSKLADQAIILGETHEARKGVKMSEHAERAAAARAKAEAALTAVAALRKIFVEAQRPYIEKEARRLALRHHPWVAFTDWVVRWWKRNGGRVAGAVAVIAVLASCWALLFWIDYANTGHHPNTRLVVCKVVTTQNWDETSNKGELDTDKGPFTLEAGQYNGHDYPSSVAAKAAFHNGDVIIVSWHGKAIGYAFIDSVHFTGKKDSCKTGGQVTGSGP